MSREVIKDLADADAVAKTAAHDLVVELQQLLKSQASVNLVLTGGTVGIKMLSELAKVITPFELERLFIWFGDERFVQFDSSDRNYVQAREALLSKISIPETNVHAMPSTEDGDLLASSSAFGEMMTAENPSFDIVLLGMGDDGHVASLFPGSAPIEFGRWVVAEPHSPKPPAQRISLSIAALSTANQVWYLVAGKEKANAVSRVFRGDNLPAAKVSGKRRTRWYLDKAAASEITS